MRRRCCYVILALLIVGCSVLCSCRMSTGNYEYYLLGMISSYDSESQTTQLTIDVVEYRVVYTLPYEEYSKETVYQELANENYYNLLYSDLNGDIGFSSDSADYTFINEIPSLAVKTGAQVTLSIGSSCVNAVKNLVLKDCDNPRIFTIHVRNDEITSLIPMEGSLYAPPIRTGVVIGEIFPSETYSLKGSELNVFPDYIEDSLSPQERVSSFSINFKDSNRINMVIFSAPPMDNTIISNLYEESNYIEYCSGNIDLSTRSDFDRIYVLQLDENSEAKQIWFTTVDDFNLIYCGQNYARIVGELSFPGEGRIRADVKMADYLDLWCSEISVTETIYNDQADYTRTSPVSDTVYYYIADYGDVVDEIEDTDAYLLCNDEIPLIYDCFRSYYRMYHWDSVNQRVVETNPGRLYVDDIENDYTEVRVDGACVTPYYVDLLHNSLCYRKTDGTLAYCDMTQPQVTYSDGECHAPVCEWDAYSYSEREDYSLEY